MYTCRKQDWLKTYLVRASPLGQQNYVNLYKGFNLLCQSESGVAGEE